MAKKVKAIVKLQLNAGKANPAQLTELLKQKLD